MYIIEIYFPLLLILIGHSIFITAITYYTHKKELKGNPCHFKFARSIGIGTVLIQILGYIPMTISLGFIWLMEITNFVTISLIGSFIILITTTCISPAIAYRIKRKKFGLVNLKVHIKTLCVVNIAYTITIFGIYTRLVRL